MTGRLRRWVVIGLLALAIIVAIAAATLPYLPVVHGTTANEVERLAVWLDVQPGMIVADLGAGDGTFAVALARRVGPSGHVYTTEIDDERLNGIREAVLEARLSNVTVIKGPVSTTNLPEGCCDALLSRLVYHHLTEPTAINADIFRSLRPGGRLMIIDFEPGGIINWISRPETADRHGGHGTPKETVIKEVMLAGFQLLRGPESWRGRTYAVLFRRPDVAVSGLSGPLQQHETEALRHVTPGFCLTTTLHSKAELKMAKNTGEVPLAVTSLTPCNCAVQKRSALTANLCSVRRVLLNALTDLSPARSNNARSGFGWHRGNRSG